MGRYNKPMNLEPTIQKYLDQHEIMQLATERDGQPWCCSLHYVVDDALTFYWMSFADRRHSQEIAANPKAAIAVAVKTDLPVIGIQVEGDAVQITDPADIEAAARLYNQKIVRSQEWLDAYLAGNDEGFTFYKLVPRMFVLFDRVAEGDPTKARQEWRPKH